MKAMRKSRSPYKIIEERRSMLSDDPERLSTEFLLRMVYGEEGMQGYIDTIEFQGAIHTSNKLYYKPKRCMPKEDTA